MKVCWEEIKNQLSNEIPKNTFSLWIRPISFVSNDGNTLTLGFPNKFSCNWVKQNYYELILDKLNSTTNRHLDLCFDVDRKIKSNPNPSDSKGPKQLTLPNFKTSGSSFKFFNKGFTFDRFIVGPSNEFAYSASQELARSQSRHYNTLLMLAKTGLGKTHLSQAVGNKIMHINPKAKVFYITAEDFTNEMISSIRNNRIDEFKNRYRRSCDVLLLEEIHFLSGKEKTQVELGYTLDALCNDNKKLIFTSSLPPKDIPRMSKELSSRLTCGLVSTIDNPDYETRVKILSEKAFEKNLNLADEIIHFIAGRLTRDVRQMESALNSLSAKSALLNVKIDLDLAKEVVDCLVTSEASISSQDVKQLVSKYYNIDPEMVSSKSRKKIYVLPRNICAYLSRRYTDETLEEIGATINRSHSTVLYASELIEANMKKDEKTRRQVQFLSKRLHNSRN